MTRRGHAVRALVVAAVCAAALGTGAPVRADVAAQGCSARAVVVVEPGPGPVAICFDGSISGLDALQLAGTNPVTYGFSGQGAAVCQLYGVGNPADQSCLVGPGGQYWAYYRAAPGATGWTYSRAGAGSTTVVNGSVEGWKYGTGGAPGFVAFCSVVSCAPPATDPPPTVPPAPSPPPAPQVGAASGSGAGSGSTPGATSGSTTGPTATTKPSSKEANDDKAEKDGAASTTGKAGTTATTAADGARSGSRRRANGVALGASGNSGGDSGSPLGVIVAVVVVAFAVAGGLWLRNRRRGPAPG